MKYFFKHIAALLAAAAFSIVSVWLGLPPASRFPLEIGALVYVAILLLWRPLRIWYSDMTFGEAMQEKPSLAAAYGLGMSVWVMVALVSIMVQLLN